jgi:hypothetical protein
MRSLRYFCLFATLCAASGSAQTTVPNNSGDDLAYFRSLFMSLANPNDTPERRQIRETGVIAQLGLTDDEAHILRGVSNEFAEHLVAFQKRADMVMVSHASMEAKHSSLKRLLAEQELMTLRLAGTLRSLLGPEVGRRLGPTTSPHR